jgi:hypothetical protein
MQSQQCQMQSPHQSHHLHRTIIIHSPSRAPTLVHVVSPCRSPTCLLVTETPQIWERPRQVARSSPARAIFKVKCHRVTILSLRPLRPRPTILHQQSGLHGKFLAPIVPCQTTIRRAATPPAIAAELGEKVVVERKVAALWAVEGAKKASWAC